MPVLFNSRPFLKRCSVKRFEDTTYVFIIRVWQEPREGGRRRIKYRGVIEQIGTTKRIYFTSFARILEIIRDLTGFEMDENPD